MVMESLQPTCGGAGEKGVIILWWGGRTGEEERPGLLGEGQSQVAAPSPAPEAPREGEGEGPIASTPSLGTAFCSVTLRLPDNLCPFLT